ncbi:dihydrofolate reductase [Siansivirga zeaxanthinifaciens]|uniref:dihydrofolate reductase n=1 Tax=Siansivirga zeaxanthinifaciens CC-SAMT-1 TaxID=1454006 RepID=A0A0C5WAC9_9FLAO|nr:dihydrofolate reductase [Siansivirga zeaxanthinifaciens]AJR03242.1 dihydrofolate reductase [Siansivirga zeaxanthinifaciens CC-SAMT-1]
MFGKKKQVPEIDKEQLELIKKAQKRIKQKKRLYSHFVFFLIGCLLLIFTNIVLGVGETFKPFGINWFVYAILFWTFLFLYHTFNVFITHKFLGKAWETQQLNKLVDAQKKRIEKLKETLQQDETLINKSKSTLSIIVAAAENNAIGKDNKLIWHLSDDLKHFKNLTNGHHIIMGRKTFESFPKPLPNRTHIVITRQEDYSVPDGVIVVNNLTDAIDAAKKDSNPYIIGGGEIYKQALNIVDKIEITRVHSTFDADTFFPEIDKSIWKETSKTFHPKDEKNNFDFSFITYERI